MKIKICGNKYPQNILAMELLKPDYLGFIFYNPSSRNVNIDTLPPLPETIQKVGVFVDASLDFINEKISQYDLQIIQLHGSETPDFCECVQKMDVKVWKVFSVQNSFDFSLLAPYENLVDAFLFDTKGTQKGGNGVVFDWAILEGYSSKTPIVLSGGIGLETLTALHKIKKSDLPIIAVDINSRFEKTTGVKDPLKIKAFKEKLQ